MGGQKQKVGVRGVLDMLYRRHAELEATSMRSPLDRPSGVDTQKSWERAAGALQDDDLRAGILGRSYEGPHSYTSYSERRIGFDAKAGRCGKSAGIAFAVASSWSILLPLRPHDLLFSLMAARWCTWREKSGRAWPVKDQAK